MNFAQVCGVVACAVLALSGCGDDRVAVGPSSDSSSGQLRDPRREPPPGARAGRIATEMSKPASIALIDDPAAVRTGRQVITGFTQGAHGRVTVLGGSAIYTPDPGYAGSDSFRYTLSSATGTTTSALVDVGVAALTPSCTI